MGLLILFFAVSSEIISVDSIGAQSTSESAPNSLELLALHVKTLAGALPLIELFDTDTVHDLKQAIQGLDARFNYQCQRLAVQRSADDEYESMNENTRALRSYCVTSTSEISLVMLTRSLPEFNVLFFSSFFVFFIRFFLFVFYSFFFQFLS